jgi:hypothetical protein
MGMAEYIAKKYMGKEICIDLDDEAETIVYSEIWAKNKEIIQGIVKSVEEGVLELDVFSVGVVVAINGDYIKAVWKPGVDWRKFSKGSVTGQPMSANRRG